MKKIKCGFSLLLALICITVSYAQQSHGLVLGKEGKPLANVSVFSENVKIAQTDSTGTFLLPPKTKWPIKLRLEHPAYYIAEVEMKIDGARFYLTAMSKKENLDEVQLTALPKDNALLMVAPQLFPLERITQKNFQAFSPELLVPVLNQTPGVYIQSGAINTNRITIRGLGSRTPYGTNRIRAYFYDIPLTDGGGETTIDMLDPELLGAVEIIKGPKAVAYGSSLGGVLLLQPLLSGSGASSLRSNHTVGSYGLLKNSVSLAASHKKLSINLHYDHLETKGFRENNSYDRSTLFLVSKYALDPKNELALLVNYIDYFAQIPSSLGKTDYLENPTQAAFTWKNAKGYEDNRKLLTGLRLAHRFSKSLTNTSSVFYTYLDHYEPRPFNILKEFTNGYGARTRFNLGFPFLHNSSGLGFGGEYYSDKYRWRTLENLYQQNNGQGSLEGNLLGNNLERRHNLNLFATVTLSFSEKFKGEFGVNFNKTHYRFRDDFNQGEANKSATRNFKPIIAPTVNLRYWFSESNSVFVNVGQGYNFPSIEETLTPEGVINPSLGPETGINFEVGNELFILKKRLRLKTNAYLMRVADLLVAERVGDDQYIGRNAGKTEHKGIEMQLSYIQNLFGGAFISPYFNAEWTNHRFIDFVDGEKDFSGNQLTGVPPRKLSGGINMQFRNFSWNGNFLHIDEIPLNDENDLSSEAYTVVNVKASYSFGLFQGLSAGIQAGINNLFDEKYAASVLINATGFGNSEPRYYYPARPRNWYCGINLKYGL